MVTEHASPHLCPLRAGTGTLGRCSARAEEKTSKHFFALKMMTIPDIIRLKQEQHVHNEKSVLKEVDPPFPGQTVSPWLCPRRFHTPAWESPVCAGMERTPPGPDALLVLPILQERVPLSACPGSAGRRGACLPQQDIHVGSCLPSRQRAHLLGFPDLSHPPRLCPLPSSLGVASWSLECRWPWVYRGHHPVDGARRAAHTCLSPPRLSSFLY